MKDEKPATLEKSVAGIVKIPETIIKQFEREAQGLRFGGLSIIANFRDSRISFRLEKVISFVAGGDQ
jgi:hypothetical protein